MKKFFALTSVCVFSILSITDSEAWPFSSSKNSPPSQKASASRSSSRVYSRIKKRVNAPSAKFLSRFGRSCTSRCQDQKICVNNGNNKVWQWCQSKCRHKKGLNNQNSKKEAWDLDNLFKQICNQSSAAPTAISPEPAASTQRLSIPPQAPAAAQNNRPISLPPLMSQEEIKPNKRTSIPPQQSSYDDGSNEAEVAIPSAPPLPSVNKHQRFSASPASRPARQSTIEDDAAEVTSPPLPAAAAPQKRADADDWRAQVRNRRDNMGFKVDRHSSRRQQSSNIDEERVAEPESSSLQNEPVRHGSGRAALLDQIQAGKKLKRVDSSEQNKVKRGLGHGMFSGQKVNDMLGRAAGSNNQEQEDPNNDDWN